MPKANITSAQVPHLHQMIANHFNLEELKTLCFSLGIRYEDLGAQTLSAKTLALQTYLERRNRLPELIKQLKLARERVDWSIFLPAEPNAPEPFKGLQSYTEADKAIFFGRETLTTELVAHIKQHRFLALVGASGSGKSSLLRAGIIPALRDQQDETANRLSIHIITPGNEPLKALAATLTKDVESVTAMKSLITDMGNDRQSLDLWLFKYLADKPKTTVLLCVDQFEELFIQCDSQTERDVFIENLVYALQIGKQERFKLALTLRSDFYSHVLQYESLRPLFETGQKIVGAMNANELRQSIEGPLQNKKWHFQEGLVETILTDFGASEWQRPVSGALPLLSHALLETWKKRQGYTMTLAGYQATGGIRGAIASTAEIVYDSLLPKEKEVARDIFLRLTRLGEGTEDTRRRAHLDEFSSEPEINSDINAILQLLAHKRLITINENSIELVHEVLIREWPRLRKWLEENRAELLIQKQLLESIQTWLDFDKDPSVLYRGLRLTQAEVWAKTTRRRLSPLEITFLQESRAALIAEEQLQGQARQRARRTPLFSLIGGAIGLSLSFLFVESSQVDNAGLLFLLTLFRVIIGGLTGLFLVFLSDTVMAYIAKSHWYFWLLCGLSGAFSFAFLLLLDVLLRVSIINTNVVTSVLAGGVWGIPAGIGRAWMIINSQFSGRKLALISLFCGLILMLINQNVAVFGDVRPLAAFLIGSVIPFSILALAYLADPDRVR